MGLADYNLSARMLEAINKIASKAVQDIYPIPRAATVTAVDRTNATATVEYPDEAGTTFVVASFLERVNIGAVVLVAGRPGTRYVSKVLTRGTEWITWNSKFKCGGTTTNITSSGVYQYDGSYINVEMGVTFTGAITAGTISIDLPVPVIAMPNLSNEVVMLGQANGLSQGVAHGPEGSVGYSGATPSSAAIYDCSTSTGIAAWTNVFPWTWKNTDATAVIFRYRWI